MHGFVQCVRVIHCFDGVSPHIQSHTHLKQLTILYIHTPSTNSVVCVYAIHGQCVLKQLL